MRAGSACAKILLVGWSVVGTARADPPAPAPSPVAAPVHAAPIERVSPALARGAVREALRAARFPERRVELSSLSSRARSAAVLPEVWLRASRSTDQSLRLTPTLDDPARYSEAGGAGVWLEARLVWHLDRLVFDRDELSVARLASEQRDAAAKLSARVLGALFDWQRARATEEDPAALPDDRDAAFFKRTEAEILLDVLTAGWFGRQLRPDAP